MTTVTMLIERVLLVRPSRVVPRSDSSLWTDTRRETTLLLFFELSIVRIRAEIGM